MTDQTRRCRRMAGRTGPGRAGPDFRQFHFRFTQRHLRSVGRNHLYTYHGTDSVRSAATRFSIAGPTAWNSLPDSVRPESRTSLKLFSLFSAGIVSSLSAFGISDDVHTNPLTDIDNDISPSKLRKIFSTRHNVFRKTFHSDCSKWPLFLECRRPYQCVTALSITRLWGVPIPARHGHARAYAIATGTHFGYSCCKPDV